MGADFFDGLGDALTKTAREIGERAEQMYEVQKIRSRISGEERMVDKILIDVGNLVYKRFENGEETDPEITVLCEEIRQHMGMIQAFKNQAADRKGQKVCRSCGKAIDKEVSYCPYCGTACSFEEQEAETEECGDDVIEENWEDNFPDKEGAAEDSCGSRGRKEADEEAGGNSCAEEGLEEKPVEEEPVEEKPVEEI